MTEQEFYKKDPIWIATKKGVFFATKYTKNLFYIKNEPFVSLFDYETIAPLKNCFSDRKSAYKAFARLGLEELKAKCIGLEDAEFYLEINNKLAEH